MVVTPTVGAKFAENNVPSGDGEEGEALKTGEGEDREGVATPPRAAVLTRSATKEKVREEAAATPPHPNTRSHKKKAAALLAEKETKKKKK
jgi:hypothetical protein